MVTADLLSRIDWAIWENKVVAAVGVWGAVWIAQLRVVITGFAYA
jgi:hypothetical protein